MEFGTNYTLTYVWGNVSLIKRPVCNKKTKSDHIFTTLSLERQLYIILFLNLALLEPKKYEKEIFLKNLKKIKS